METLNPYLAPILKALDLYLDRFPQTNEHLIIKHLQDEGILPFDQFELAQAKDLFNAHFLCMHALYHLKNNYQSAKRYRLTIQSVRVARFQFNHPSSDQHTTAVDLDIADPLASYYLNPAHYFETREEDITDMLKSFWTKYLAQDKKQEALQVLELPHDANAKMVKEQYKRLAQKHHPDKGGCAKKFHALTEAKTTLENLIC